MFFLTLLFSYAYICFIKSLWSLQYLTKMKFYFLLLLFIKIYSNYMKKMNFKQFFFASACLLLYVCQNNTNWVEELLKGGLICRLYEIFMLPLNLLNAHSNIHESATIGIESRIMVLMFGLDERKDECHWCLLF